MIASLNQLCVSEQGILPSLLFWSVPPVPPVPPVGKSAGDEECWVQLVVGRVGLQSRECQISQPSQTEFQLNIILMKTLSLSQLTPQCISSFGKMWNFENHSLEPAQWQEGEDWGCCCLCQNTNSGLRNKNKIYESDVRIVNIVLVVFRSIIRS